MSLSAPFRATKTALSSDPNLAGGKFEAHHDGGATKVTVKAGSGQQLIVDEPEVLGAGDVVANSVEYALGALGWCQAVTYRIWAAQLGVQLDKVEIDVDGDIDLRGMLGIDDRIRAGFNAVRIRVILKGPETAARYQDLAAVVDAHCPTLDLFRNPVAVQRELVSAPTRSALTIDRRVEAPSISHLGPKLQDALPRARSNRVGVVLTFGDIDLDRQNWRVRRAGRNVQMGAKEFRLLEHLMVRPGQVFSRAQLVDNIWGLTTDIDERTVDVYIGRMRKALSQDGERDPIRTVRGVGYAFDETYGKAS